MIHSINKDLKNSGFDEDCQKYVSQLLNHAVEKDLPVTLIINNSAEDVSRAVLDSLAALNIPASRVLYRERISGDSRIKTLHSLDAKVNLPVSTCLLVGSESYFLVKGHQASGFFDQKDASAIMMRIADNIERLFF